MKLYGVAGWKNTGKTGLVTGLVAHFAAAGLKVSTIKHAHHAFDVDHEGRDSYRHRAAGAGEVLVASSARLALMRELKDAPEPTLDELLAMLAPADLVLVEGFKSGPHPKIEAHRAAADRPLLAPNDPSIRAIAADVALPQMDRPIFDLNDIAGIAGFIAGDLGLKL